MTSSETSSGERRRIWRSLTSSQRTSVALLVQERDERRLEVGAGVLVAQLLRRAAEQQLAVGQHERAVGVALGLADVVGRVDDGRGELAHERPQTLALARVQRG